jgi:restriction system protein
MKLPENSLFSILMRKDWWVSALGAVMVFLLVWLFMPWGYALFATTPFIIIIVLVLWKQYRTPSGERLARKLEEIRALSWDEFAVALEPGFKAEGYTVQRAKGVADFELEKLGYLTLVSARRWKVAHTGVEPIKELVAAGEQREARACWYVVAGDLSAPARTYAKENGVTLIEGAALLQRVRR